MEILIIIGLLIYFGPVLLGFGLVLLGLLCSVEFWATVGVVGGICLFIYLGNKLNKHNS